MFASLPMYAAPHAAAAHQALWAGVRDRLRARGIDAPETLDQTTPPIEGWSRPDLLLGQICNLPYRAHFRDRVQILGLADYAVEGAAPGFYYSVMIVRRDDPARSLEECAGYRFALNDVLSNSGWQMPLRAAAAAEVALRPHLVTGSHAASLAAVAEGRADLAAIDAISWDRVLGHDPAREAVRVLARTEPTVGMTFVTGPTQEAGPIRDALAAAIADLAPGHRETLGLRGLVPPPEGAYDLPPPPPPHLD